MSVTLFHAPMSSASPVLWAITELGIDFESVQLDIRSGNHKTDALMAHNPFGQVPTLVDGEQGMFESSAITIYLGERYGVSRGLWPEVGSAAHMRALSWVNFMAVSLGASLRMVMLNGGEYLPEEAQSAQQLAMAQGLLETRVGALNEHLGQHAYLAGDDFSLADTYASAGTAWGLKTVGYDMTRCPNLADWQKRCLARPAAKVMDVGNW